MICILLSTYNGSHYLREMFASLEKQTFSNWQLLVRDDGSTDNTKEILDDLQNHFSDKIKLLDDNLGNLGSQKSFMHLLKHASSPYIMFCDQDDLWLPNKIEQTLDAFQNMEQSYTADQPLLLFTDMHVVNSDLTTLNPSFWAYQKLNPKIAFDWKKLLVQNVITGCTLMINQAAKNVSLPFDVDVMMHDHWIGVNVSKYGHIRYLNIPTLLYRQHGSNVEGARQFGWILVFKKIKNIPVPLKKIYLSSKYFKVSLSQSLFRKVVLNLRRFFINNITNGITQ